MSHTSEITSSEIARQAGVSRATVSVVLSGTRSTSRVSDATRQRVLAVAAELGYAPHPVARALRRKRTGVLGFIPRARRTTLFDHPVPYLLGIALSRAAAAYGYQIVETTTDPVEAHGSDDLVRFMQQRRVDGIILDSPGTVEEVERFIEHRIPLVQIIRPQPLPTARVTVDAQPGIVAAVAHLLDAGHRRIAWLGRGGEHPIDRARRAAFLAALDQHGLRCPAHWLREVADYGVAEGFASAMPLLADHDRPTALIAMGDNIALGVLRALYTLRLRVPDDFSLISYDDAFAGVLYPPLTSVAQPLTEVGARAIAMLHEQIEGEPGTFVPRAETVPTDLIARESVGAPRGVWGE